MTCFADLTACARKELWASLALRHARGIGPRRAKLLLERFGSAFAAVEAGMSFPAKWGSLGISANTASGFSGGSWRDEAQREWTALQKEGCRFLVWSDTGYPEPLRQIVDPPLLLYYKGDPAFLGGPAVGVVGARSCTREGMRTTAVIARGLSRAGVAVVSGMARGIDRAAHLAGLEGPGGSVAVLGTGIDVVYPDCNKDLYEHLSTRGIILSEFPPGTPPLPKHFPIRNRLISGLSQGILVVEAARRSGSLITARLALEQNREVFVVPGPALSEASSGCQDLLLSGGGRAAFKTDDILQELAPQLTLEARRALEKRLLEREQAKSSLPRTPVRGSCSEELASAENPLPEGPLPWLAPQPAREAPTTTTRPAPDVAPPEKLLPEALLNDAESRVLAAMNSRIHIDDLARQLDMPIASLSSLLVMLEIRGLAGRTPGMLYYRKG